jgi:hypothetical protein
VGLLKKSTNFNITYHQRVQEHLPL